MNMTYFHCNILQYKACLPATVCIECGQCSGSVALLGVWPFRGSCGIQWSVYIGFNAGLGTWAQTTAGTELCLLAWAWWEENIPHRLNGDTVEVLSPPLLDKTRI